MSLIDVFKTSCTLLIPSEVSDGAGGFVTTWAESTTFNAAITLNSDLVLTEAYKENLNQYYNVTSDQSLSFHDVFKRNADGKVFRVTSDCIDRTTPLCASFSFKQVTAEEWQLTGDITPTNEEEQADGI